MTEQRVINCFIYLHGLIGLALVFSGGLEFGSAINHLDTRYALNVSLFGYGTLLLAILERVISGIAYR